VPSFLLPPYTSNAKIVGRLNKNKKASARMNASKLTHRCLVSVLFGVFLELMLTRGRTKIVGSSLIFGLPGGILFIDLHSANRIGFHKFYYLPVKKLFGLRFAATAPTIAEFHQNRISFRSPKQRGTLSKI
jgi:hypothetical protein